MNDLITLTTRELANLGTNGIENVENDIEELFNDEFEALLSVFGLMK